MAVANIGNRMSDDTSENAELKTPKIIVGILSLLREKYSLSYQKISNISKSVCRFKKTGMKEASSVKKIFEGGTALSYKHLEQLQYIFALPTGVILSCSHATSEIRDCNYDNTKELGIGLIALGNAIIDQSEKVASGEKKYNENAILGALLVAYKKDGFLPTYPKIEKDIDPEMFLYLKNEVGDERYQEFLKKFPEAE